ncbi:MAG: efflux RND transporter periplasmic adaptor subunit [Planctomycetes bacterium]|nr:efflux RND transporter periplasmic adaptor subunit [Planctomycetota bacterium]
MKRIFTSRWLLLPLVMCATALAGCNRNGQQLPPPKAPEVLVSFPVTDQITDYEYFTGRTEPIHSVEIKARVTGYLDKIDFKDGADVKEGAPLFEIDPRPYRAERDRAQATRAQAIAHRDLSQAKLERTRAAFPTRAASKEDLDAAVAEADADKASVRIAEENLRIAELNLAWTVVKAPIEGRLTQRRVDPGNLVKADDTLLTTLHKLHPMYALFDVDERTVLKLSDLERKGTIKRLRDGSVEVELGLASEEDYPHKGKIDFASAFLDSSTGTRAVRGVFDNQNHVLMPGLFVRIRLPVGEPHSATLIEERALGTDQGRKFVYALKKEKVTEEKDGQPVERTLYKAVYRPVTPGTLSNGKRVVQDGLALDELVIVSGLQRVQADHEVIPMIRGKLRARVEGGEPAGTVTTDAGAPWELDFSKLSAEEKEKLAETAKNLNGELVLVKGTPVVRRDGTRGRRLVVIVREMKATK